MIYIWYSHSKRNKSSLDWSHIVEQLHFLLCFWKWKTEIHHDYTIFSQIAKTDLKWELTFPAQKPQSYTFFLHLHITQDDTLQEFISRAGGSLEASETVLWQFQSSTTQENWLQHKPLCYHWNTTHMGKLVQIHTTLAANSIKIFSIYNARRYPDLKHYSEQIN